MLISKLHTCPLAFLMFDLHLFVCPVSRVSVPVKCVHTFDPAQSNPKSSLADADCQRNSLSILAVVSLICHLLLYGFENQSNTRPVTKRDCLIRKLPNIFRLNSESLAIYLYHLLIVSTHWWWLYFVCNSVTFTFLRFIFHSQQSVLKWTNSTGRTTKNSAKIRRKENELHIFFLEVRAEPEIGVNVVRYQRQ